VSVVPWTLSVTQWTLREPDPARALDRVAEAGYRGIELAADPEADGAVLARAIRDAGLEVTSLCAVYSLERDFAAAEDALRRAAHDNLLGCLELADVVGAPVIVVVPSYRVEREYDRAAELDRAAATIASVVDQSGYQHALLALEPLNRYEAHLLTTLSEADELRSMIGRPRIALMADLFHMGIEEDSTPAALRRYGAQVAHVHLADNQRRHPGSGQLDFAGAFTALHEREYQGALAMEFLPASDAALVAGREHVERTLAAVLQSSTEG
jgi:sugar phosphate isomerase/epimerase